MQLELKCRHDPEIAASTADRPEEVRILHFTGVDQLSARGYQVHRADGVECEPEAPRQPADSSAGRESADTYGRGTAERHRQSVRVCLVVHEAGQRSTSDPGPPRACVHADAPHQTKVEHHPPVTRRDSEVAMTAALDGQQQTVLAGEIDR